MNSNKVKTPKIAAELDELINRALDTSLFPYVKGKSIRIKHIIIRETNFGFLVFDTKSTKEICKTFCKTSAVAVAKSLAGGRCISLDRIILLDDIIKKNYNDALFFKHILDISSDSTRRFVAESRYDIAAIRTRTAKEELDRIIYS
jgi:hypothetical protein